uniref:Predicted protein n=1 Tax=Hordeum vulgare subsp. vulgare TaxID=112509 RepID=F2D0X0_HORVV|nr:predicted protein [Hordeum vulgare subsp. vulgare]
MGVAAGTTPTPAYVSAGRVGALVDVLASVGGEVGVALVPFLAPAHVASVVVAGDVDA